MRPIDGISKSDGTSFADLVLYCTYNQIPYTASPIRDNGDPRLVRPFERTMRVELPSSMRGQFTIGSPERVDVNNWIYTAHLRLDKPGFLEDMTGSVILDNGHIREITRVTLVEKLYTPEPSVPQKPG